VCVFQFPPLAPRPSPKYRNMEKSLSKCPVCENTQCIKDDGMCCICWEKEILCEGCAKIFKMQNITELTKLDNTHAKYPKADPACCLCRGNDLVCEWCASEKKAMEKIYRETDLCFLCSAGMIWKNCNQQRVHMFDLWTHKTEHQLEEERTTAPDHWKLAKSEEVRAAEICEFWKTSVYAKFKNRDANTKYRTLYPSMVIAHFNRHISRFVF